MRNINSVLPKKVTKRLAVEAGTPFGWYKYIGFEGDIISIDHFGASAPDEILFEKFVSYRKYITKCFTFN